MTETDAELYGRPILTESNGLVSSAKWEAVSRLAVRLSPTPNHKHNTRCVGRVNVASVGLEKARLSGRECSRRRPTGDQDSLCRTGEDGKVKFWSGCLADIPLAGVTVEPRR